MSLWVVEHAGRLENTSEHVFNHQEQLTPYRFPSLYTGMWYKKKSEMEDFTLTIKKRCYNILYKHFFLSDEYTPNVLFFGNGNVLLL